MWKRCSQIDKRFRSVPRQARRAVWVLAGLLAVVAPPGCGRETPTNKERAEKAGLAREQARLDKRKVALEKEKTALEALGRHLEVALARAQVDDKGHVWNLQLRGPLVDDAVMEPIVHLTRLRSLGLYHTSITDAGIARLTELKRVQDLNINGPGVSDQGLAVLHKVTSLRRLWVRTNGRVTTKGIDSLKKALPGLFVDDEALRIPGIGRGP